MTVTEIMNQIYELTGRPSNLNPTVVGSASWTTLLAGVNLAIKSVASYKDKVTGRFFHYNQFRKEGFLTYTPITGTVGATSTTTSINLGSLPSGETDVSGSILSINGEEKIIISNTAAGVVTVHDAFSSITVGDDYTLYRRWINIPSAWNFYEILTVDDIDNDASLYRAHDSERFLTSLVSITNPSYYYRVGRRLYLNTVPEEATDFRVWYYRLPATVTGGDSEVELPESSHFAVVLWGVYWAYQFLQEPNDAYAAQLRFADYMRTMKSEYDVKDSMNQKYSLSIKIK
jgi:hypothetical protein